MTSIAFPNVGVNSTLRGALRRVVHVLLAP
jgi:hypothetical protein